MKNDVKVNTMTEIEYIKVSNFPVFPRESKLKTERIHKCQ